MFLFTRVALTTALFGAVSVSAIPVNGSHTPPLAPSNPPPSPSVTSALPPSPSTSGLPRVIERCIEPMTVALSFDDGPYNWTTQLVDLLRDNGAKATFCMNGDNWGCIYGGDNPAHVKYAYDNGMQICSHGWSHANMSTLTGAALRSEFTRINDAIKEITGAFPNMMRAPYGEIGGQFLQEVASPGIDQTVILWDFDSGDTTGATAEESKKAYKDLIDSNPKNVLALNHETKAPTVMDVIPYVIKLLNDKGYRMVTVAECLGASPYRDIGQPTTPLRTSC